MKDIRDAFPSKYLKASDLQGRDVIVTIKGCEYEAVGQDKSVKPVLYFRGKEKGLVLNKTNCNVIIQLTNSPDPDEWIGVPITLYPTETSFQGDQVDCIRIRKDAPAARRALRRPAAVEPMIPKPTPQPDPEPAPDDVEQYDGLTDDDIPF